MVNIDVQSITNELLYYGTSITLIIVTDASYSKWGDATETSSNQTKNAFIQILSQEDQLVIEGNFQAGDKLFWFKGDETNINRGNRITHDSNNYEIIESIKHDVAGTTYIIEARTRKV